ncbi:MAG: terminase family protein [Bryobacteraceae bacterium]|nr:terminase family protein [Bryobacteraceae bacterium]
MSTSLATRLARTERRIAQRRWHERHARGEWVDPVFFARQTLGFAPDPWQERVLRWQGKRLVLNCCRQSGKSTITAILALHHALYTPTALVLLISPSLRQSSELFRKVHDFLSLLPLRPALTEDNKLSLQMRNGSRIVSLPSKEGTIRGFSSVSLLIEDEAARVPDDLFLACKPMLAVSQGRHILMSTPWGKRGHFFEAWEHGGETWERIQITASDCPRISPAFLAEEQENMPAPWFASEYLCEFTDTEDSVFSYEHVMNALSGAVEPLFLTVQHAGALDPQIRPLGGRQ